MGLKPSNWTPSEEDFTQLAEDMADAATEVVEDAVSNLG